MNRATDEPGSTPITMHEKNPHSIFSTLNHVALRPNGVIIGYEGFGIQWPKKVHDDTCVTH